MGTPCCVPFCKRKHRRERGWFICGDHWRDVPKISKACLRDAIRRRARVDWLFWLAQCKAEAIEAASGIGPTPGLIAEEAMATLGKS